MKGWLVLVAVMCVGALTTGCASTSAASECRIVLNGYSEAQLTNVTADSVSIHLSGHSNVRINELTSISIDTETRDYSRLDIGKSNQEESEDSE